jgi:crotonobetainyl-CoA:carnitine CoA-transferase CaiB-like acyl-CoA transferase
VRFPGDQTRSPTPAPKNGEHGREILAELGYDAQRIELLIQSRAVRVSTPDEPQHKPSP